MDSESSAPSSVSLTRAEPLSLASLDAVATLGPANHVTSESSTLRLSASKSNASVPWSGRCHPRDPRPLVNNPGCCSRNESTCNSPSANRTLVAPLSMIVPAKNDGASMTESCPMGFVTLSASTVPVAVNVSRDGGAPARVSQRCKLRS